MPKGPKPLYMVTSCGTSLLTKQAGPELNGLLKETANAQAEDLSWELRRSIEDRVKQQGKMLMEADLAEVHRLSAELNGLLTYYRDELTGRERDHHVFLYTDTLQGELTARTLVEWCRGKGLNVELQQAKDVQTRNLTAFQTGMADLVQWCYQVVPGYRDSGYRVVFNLVGGFKSFQGFLQTLGMLYADECVSLFEGEQELLRIPRLPLSIEEGVRSTFKEHLNFFRRLGWGGRVQEDRSRSFNIPETLLMVMDKKVGFSLWGEMIWNFFKTDQYRKSFLPSPYPQIRYSQKFEVKAAQYDSLFSVLNTRIDDLARYMEFNFQKDLDRLNFKKLVIPHSISTHQCDLTADRGGLRLFGYFEKTGKQEVFVIDDLDRGIGH